MENLMEFENGKVVAVGNGKATVQIEPGAHCHSCGHKNGCVTLENESVRQIELPIEGDIKVGDHVSIEYKPQSRILSAFILFIVPLLSLIGGYFIGFTFFKAEGKAILTAFGSLAFCFLIIWEVGKLLNDHKTFIPSVVNVTHQIPTTEYTDNE